MSFIEDDSLNGSVIKSDRSEVFNDSPKLKLRDRIIEYGMKHKQFTKDDIYINISSSGVATVIVKSLIQKGIFIEHTFDCGACRWYSIDQTKINID